MIMKLRYDQSGWIEDLPPMQQNRNWHGCASYKTDSGTELLICPLLDILLCR